VSTEPKQEKQGLIDKATTRNVVAALGVAAGIVVTAYYQKWELFAVLVTACATYLFPKTQK
jgi:hypothetical protein